MYITCYNILLHFITCMIIINSCDSLQGNHPRVRRRNKPAMWMIWMISEGAQGPIWLFNFSAIHWEPRSYPHSFPTISKTAFLQGSGGLLAKRLGK